MPPETKHLARGPLQPPLLNNGNGTDWPYTVSITAIQEIMLQPTLVLPHPQECAIVLVRPSAPNGSALKRHDEQSQQVVKVRNLRAATDCGRLAADVLKACPAITANRLDEIVCLLRFLQRKHASGTAGRGSRGKPGALPDDAEWQVSSETLARVGDLVETLYDDTRVKVATSRTVLGLVVHPEYAAAVLEQEALVNALARVLREDSKRSVELALNVTQLFLFVSHFGQEHDVLRRNKAGDACLRAVDVEQNRQQVWREDYERTRAAVLEPEALRVLGLKYAAKVSRQNQLLYAALHTLNNLARDPATLGKMLRRGLVKQLTTLLGGQATLSGGLQFLVLLFLQRASCLGDSLPAFTEERRTLLKQLLRVITEPSADVASVSIALRLAANLAADADMRRHMVRREFPVKIADALNANPNLEDAAVATLYRLSADGRGCDALAKTSILELLVNKLVTPRRSGSQGCSNELAAALALNLASSPACALALVRSEQGSGLVKSLLRSALGARDAVQLRLLRALVASAAIAGSVRATSAIGDNAEELCRSLAQTTGTHPDFAAECAGLLSALHLVPRLDWTQLAVKFDLVAFATAQITTAMCAGARAGPLESPLIGLAANDDLLLELLGLVGVLGAHASPAIRDQAAQSELVVVLGQIVLSRELDDAILVHALFALSHFLSDASSVQQFTQNPELVVQLNDLVVDCHPQVAQLAGACLDRLIEFSEPSAQDVIKEQKFHAYNKTWLELVVQDIVDREKGVKQTGRVSEGGAVSETYSDQDDDDAYGYRAQLEAVLRGQEDYYSGGFDRVNDDEDYDDDAVETPEY